MCPWPRIQAALTDVDALNVTYRRDRGEPRVSLKDAAKARAAGQPAGDCIDCDQCVAVCPTGVDIRNGSQLGCIQCGLCIDACDAVMAKVHRPTRLIGYDTDENIKRRQRGEAPRLPARAFAHDPLRGRHRAGRRADALQADDAPAHGPQRAARARADVHARLRTARCATATRCASPTSGASRASSRWPSAASPARVAKSEEADALPDGRLEGRRRSRRDAEVAALRDRAALLGVERGRADRHDGDRLEDRRDGRRRRPLLRAVEGCADVLRGTRRSCCSTRTAPWPSAAFPDAPTSTRPLTGRSCRHHARPVLRRDVRRQRRADLHRAEHAARRGAGELLRREPGLQPAHRRGARAETSSAGSPT